MRHSITLTMHILLTFCDEEIHDSQCYRMTAEHIITARAHTLYRHAQATPNGICP